MFPEHSARDGGGGWGGALGRGNNGGGVRGEK